MLHKRSDSLTDSCGRRTHGLVKARMDPTLGICTDTAPLSLTRWREYKLKQGALEPCKVGVLCLKRLCVRGNAKLKTCKKYSVQLEIWHISVTIDIKENPTKPYIQ